MKQGITPQYWKQENNGRYFTKETQIFSPLPILTTLYWLIQNQEMMASWLSLPFIS